MDGCAVSTFSVGPDNVDIAGMARLSVARPGALYCRESVDGCGGAANRWTAGTGGGVTDNKVVVGIRGGGCGKMG